MSRTYEQLEPVISALDDRIKTNLGAFPTDTAEGSIVSFPDGAYDVPLKSLVVNIDPVQSGSGDPSPDNVRPISGWAGANVVASGKNLFDIQSLLLETGTYASGVLTDTIGNLFKAFGQNGKTMPFVPPKGQLAISFNTYTDGNQSTIGRGFSINAKYTDGTASTIVSVTNATTTKTYGSGATNASKTVESLYINFGEGGNNIWHISDLQIELGSTATNYEPYNGQTIPISWQTEAGTVYGGSLDVLSGVLTVDMAMVDLGTLTWSYVSSSEFNFRASELVGAKPPGSAVATPNAICSIYPVLGYTTISDSRVDALTVIFATSAQAGKVWAHNGTYSDVASFKSAVTGQQLVYELAEPIEIQLTPHQVRSLLGQNNIFADTGDTEVEYRADTKMYIERLTEPDADMIADANITSGSYFMVGNILYKATANIASGSAVIVGTNCTQKSLSEALNEINQ